VVGTVGLLVDPRSVGQIADAMGACLEQGSLLQRAAEEGLRRAATFSWKETGQQITRLLQGLS
jgi:glycosyltransferase involved in cell wall biosynthesis